MQLLGNLLRRFLRLKFHVRCKLVHQQLRSEVGAFCFQGRSYIVRGYFYIIDVRPCRKYLSIVLSISLFASRQCFVGSSKILRREACQFFIFSFSILLFSLTPFTATGWSLTSSLSPALVLSSFFSVARSIKAPYPRCNNTEWRERLIYGYFAKKKKESRAKRSDTLFRE